MTDENNKNTIIQAMLFIGMSRVSKCLAAFSNFSAKNSPTLCDTLDKRFPCKQKAKNLQIINTKNASFVAIN